VSARKPRAAPRRTRKRKPRGERTESTIYAGSRLMGELVGRIGDFTARDAEGKRLGKFKAFEAAREPYAVLCIRSIIWSTFLSGVAA
jgi:hypothetical protein